MKILEINKYFYIKGGCETYYFNLIEVLEAHNHEIMHFSMEDERNYESSYSRYFVKRIDYNHQSIVDKVINAGKIIYSIEARNKLRELLKKERPDIAHLHNIYHQLSPSIIDELHKQNIPIVLTAHDYKLICPNYKMYRDSIVCEECKGHHYYNCLKNKCSKQSTAASLVNTVEMYLHYYKKTYDKIDRLITPSKFLKNKFIELGYDSQKIEQVYNFVDMSKYQPSHCYKDYFVSFGRISEEKGILTLLEAMKTVAESTLKVIGDGPLLAEAKEYVQDNKLNNVEFLGFKTGKELMELIGNSMFVTINSEWYENNPMSVIEAMSLGKGIVGSRIGGIPELIEEGVNGYIYETGNAASLSKALNKMISTKTMAPVFGAASREKAERYFNQESHYNTIIKSFQEVINAKKDRHN